MLLIAFYISLFPMKVVLKFSYYGLLAIALRTSVNMTLIKLCIKNKFIVNNKQHLIGTKFDMRIKNMQFSHYLQTN